MFDNWLLHVSGEVAHIVRRIEEPGVRGEDLAYGRDSVRTRLRRARDAASAGDEAAPGRAFDEDVAAAQDFAARRYQLRERLVAGELDEPLGDVADEMVGEGLFGGLVLLGYHHVAVGEDAPDAAPAELCSVPGLFVVAGSVVAPEHGQPVAGEKGPFLVDPDVPDEHDFVTVRVDQQRVAAGGDVLVLFRQLAALDEFRGIGGVLTDHDLDLGVDRDGAADEIGFEADARTVSTRQAESVASWSGEVAACCW